MKQGVLTGIASGLTALACGWASRDLLNSWSVDPFSENCEWVFVVWMAVVVWLFCREKAQHVISLSCVSLAAVLFLIGRITDISVVSHLALSVAVVSYLSSVFQRICCVALSLSWFPAFGWLGHHFLDVDLGSVRLLCGMVLAGLVVMSCLKKHQVELKNSVTA